MGWQKSLVVVLGLGFACIGNSQTLVSGTYSQDFNTLASSGTANPWVQDGTIAEWWAYRFPNIPQTWFDVTQYVANNGATATGTLYSFGPTGSLDRALGSIGTGNDASGAYRYGTGFTNGFLGAITSMDIGFRGETWRVGTPGNSNNVEFQYSINATSVNDNVASWIDFDALDYNEATNSVSGPFDGNAGFLNKQATISGLNINPGATVWIRWTDIDHPGADHGLAIDDLTVSFATAGDPVPEPATISILAASTWAALRRRSKKNQTPQTQQTR